MQLNPAVFRTPIGNWDTLQVQCVVKDLLKELDKRRDSLQYLDGGVLKLPHWNKPKYLSKTQADVLKIIWGASDAPPPVVTWSAVNKRVGSGYCSFDQLFYSSEAKDDILEHVGFGKYRLRRL